MTKALPSDFQLVLIPVKQLNVIWAQSQRPYRPSRAKKIAAEFNIYRFDPIKVTLPNGAGVYHVVEGQHRKAAFEMVHGSEEAAPCIVIPSEGPKEAAQHFDGINGLRWRVDPVSTFRVRVTAGYATECGVDKVVRKYGYKIGAKAESKTSGSSSGSRWISAVAAVVSIYTINGPKVLAEVLQVLSATWANDPNGTSGYLIRGYGSLLGEYGTKVNWGTLTSAVKKRFTPGSLLAAAKQNQEIHGGSMGDAVARTLFGIYNRAVKADKKLKHRADMA